MADRPLVYRTSNIERLEHYRERYRTAGPRERTRIAMEQGKAIEDLLIETFNEVQAIRKDLIELLRRAKD